jgi:hypothetical protein
MVFTVRAMRFSKIRRPQRRHTTEYFAAFCKGDDGGGDTPLPIPNREVKPASADGTAGETPWESRSSPIFFARRFAPRSTPPGCAGRLVSVLPAVACRHAQASPSLVSTPVSQARRLFGLVCGWWLVGGTFSGCFRGTLPMCNPLVRFCLCLMPGGRLCPSARPFQWRRRLGA